MRLAKDLGLTLEQALEMSNLEFCLWVSYYTLEAKEQKEHMRKTKNGRR
jgi:hypothetical protein